MVPVLSICRGDKRELSESQVEDEGTEQHMLASSMLASRKSLTDFQPAARILSAADLTFNECGVFFLRDEGIFGVVCFELE